MFGGFKRETVSVEAVDFSVYRAGAGNALLLLHGYPQTALAWRKVASQLAKHFEVIMPDLPGYGDSRVHDASAFDFSKRNIARLLLALVRLIAGEGTILLAGHDRGARVAYRMCLDRPDAVQKVVLIDIIPTIEVAEMLDYREALKTYHWLFLAQPHPLPERLIESNVDFYIRNTIERWAGNMAAVGESAIQHYVNAFQKASVRFAACQDYRMGLSVDIEHDDADRHNQSKLQMPLRVLNSAHYQGDVAQIEQIWSRWASDFDVVNMDCGHFIMDELPEQTIAAMLEFYRQR